MSNKIDSLVAEKVMGWVRHPRNTAHWVEGGRNPFMAPVMGLVPECGMGAWSPSTDISAAWAVVEEWGVLPWSIDNGWREKDGERLSGVTCKVTTHTDSFEAIEKDAPLAICVCALRAVGVPEQQIQEALQ